jgi:tetratricopeptide (TPR) repeat protein
MNNKKNLLCCRKGKGLRAARFGLLVCLAIAIVLQADSKAQNATTFDRLERAAEMIRKGQLAAAEAELNVVIRRTPREANALNLLGVVRAQQHRPREAEQLFLRAIEVNKSLLGAYLNIGQLYLDLAKPDRALWAFTEAGKLQPENPSINFNLASLYEQKKEYQRALECLSKIPQAQVDSDTLFLMAKSHLALNHLQEAKALSAPLKESSKVPPDMAAAFAAVFAQYGLFDEAIEILEAARQGTGPSYALLYNLGASLYQKGERHRAEEAYLAGLSLKPNDVPSLRALANIARADGELEKALSYLVRARKVAPDSPAVLFDFGWIALNMNLLYDSLSALERLHQMKPAEPDYLYPLAIARLNNGESARALSLINRYIESRPQDGRGLFVLGAIHYGAKRFTEARVALQRSLSLANYPDTEYYLGMIAHNEGDEEQAISWFRRALNSDPQNSATHSALGIALAKQKNYQAARTELEKAVDLDPKDQTAHYQLGIVYGRLGEKERSRAMFAISEKLRSEQKERQGLGVRLVEPIK